jgi:hypothetical protein
VLNIPTHKETTTMNTAKLPVKRNTPLTAHEAFDRICDLRAGRPERLKLALEAFEGAERDAEGCLALRVPEDQRGRLGVMLAAMPEADRAAVELVASRAAE